MEYARATTAQERVRCLVKLVEKDNEVFKISITDPRIEICQAKIAEPINPFPSRKFAVRDDLLTLPSGAWNRYETYYDFSALPIWGIACKKKIMRKEWGNVINVIWSTWEHAQVVAFMREAVEAGGSENVLSGGLGGRALPKTLSLT